MPKGPAKMLATQGRGARAVVIVAHPDDEVIWAGGLILRQHNWDWTVFCLCRGDDTDRRPKFDAVCDLLGVTGVISDLNDGNPPAAITPDNDVCPRILDAVGQTPWDICLTHGNNGEYGHLRHRQTHEAALGLLRNGLLDCGELWTFAYECESPSGRCRPADWADEEIELTQREWTEKRRIVRDVYGYPETGFEVMACIRTEAFSCRWRAEEEESYQ
jgi:hypothetical protein